MDQLINPVLKFVVENFLYGDESRLRGDTSFLKSGIIDSTGILELVGFLESHFGIRVEDEELVPENLDSLTTISSYLDRKLNSSSAL